jgi:hypothetical protein
MTVNASKPILNHAGSAVYEFTRLLRLPDDSFAYRI